jgi:signal transduction histidine kinase/ActR/RegA family two-component response regulator
MSRLGALGRVPLGLSTISGKLLLPLSAALGAIALFVFLYFPSAAERKGKDALLAEGKAIAAMAAYNAEPGVVFGNTRNIEEALYGTLETAEVARVEVHDVTGDLLARVSRAPSSEYPALRHGHSEDDGLLVTEPVLSRGDTVGSVTVFLSRAMLRETVKETRALAGGLAFFIFVLGVLALIALTTLVTRPLGAIVEAAGAIAGGDLSRRAPEKAGDEVGTLARAFNQMVNRLEESQGKLQEINLELEQRVAEGAKDLMESQAKLQQIQKMEAVGRLAGGVAHDFNNLLTVITGHVDLLLLERTENDPDFAELEDMKKAADRAADLTRQLLAFGRRQVLRPRHVDPNRLVSDTVGMLSRVMGEHIRVETRCASGVGQIVADPGQLERAILNMGINARDAMPRGGVLTLETESIDHIRARLAWAAALPPGRYVMMVIRDTGIGIAKSDLPKVFEPFFSTKELGGGSGLGLAMVHGIVSQSGGFIFADSEPGRGTEFRLFFPELNSPDSAAGLAAEDPSESTLIQGTETILVVEDEDMVRKLTCSVLRRAGYNVLEVAGSLEAIGVLKNHQGTIHLVLTDVIMPGMTGDELADRVEIICPEAEILFMSGHSGAALDGVVNRGIDLLQKPFTADELTRTVRDCLDGIRSGVAA